MADKKIRIPLQKRGIERKDHIMESAIQLFSEKGYHAVSSNEIAAHAGVSIGSFYAYFPDKNELLLEIVKKINFDFYDVAFGELNPDEINIDDYLKEDKLLVMIEQLLNNAVEATTRSMKFYKTIYVMQFSDEKIAILMEDGRKKDIGFLVKLLERFKPHLKVADINLAAKIIHINIENIATYIHYIGTGFTKDQLIKESSLMIYRYLFSL